MPRASRTVEQLGVTDHRLHPGQPCRVEGAERGERVEPLGFGPARTPRAHEVMAPASSSAPVGRPSGSQTTSAYSSTRSPRRPRRAPVRPAASAVWPSKKPTIAGDSPIASAIASARMPESWNGSSPGAPSGRAPTGRARSAGALAGEPCPHLVERQRRRAGPRRASGIVPQNGWMWLSTSPGTTAIDRAVDHVACAARRARLISASAPTATIVAVAPGDRARGRPSVVKRADPGADDRSVGITASTHAADATPRTCQHPLARGVRIIGVARLQRDRVARLRGEEESGWRRP